MPLYIYKCTNCGFSQELLRQVDQRDEPAICLSCGQPRMKRLPASGISFTFKAATRQSGDVTISARGSTV